MLTGADSADRSREWVEMSAPQVLILNMGESSSRHFALFAWKEGLGERPFQSAATCAMSLPLILCLLGLAASSAGQVLSVSYRCTL